MNCPTVNNNIKEYWRECPTLSQTLVENIRPIAAEYERIGDECLLGKLSPRQRTILRRELVQKVAKLCREANQERSLSKIKVVLKNQAPRRLCRRAAHKCEKESEQSKWNDERSEGGGGGDSGEEKREEVREEFSAETIPAATEWSSVENW
jgi:hypothetical protein